MESKQRLRPWLEAQINNGEIPGLCWLNPPEKTKFRIPWKHGGKQDWNPDSGQIFKVQQFCHCSADYDVRDGNVNVQVFGNHGDGGPKF